MVVVIFHVSPSFIQLVTSVVFGQLSSVVVVAFCAYPLGKDSSAFVTSVLSAPDSKSVTANPSFARPGENTTFLYAYDSIEPESETLPALFFPIFHPVKSTDEDVGLYTSTHSSSFGAVFWQANTSESVSFAPAGADGVAKTCLTKAKKKSDKNKNILVVSPLTPFFSQVFDNTPMPIIWPVV